MPLARFANAAYSGSDLKGYTIDASNSNQNYTTYVNHSTKEAILAYSGTRRNKHDIYQDGMILIGQGHKTKRHADSMRAAERLHDKYSKHGYKTAVTGHSLGGRMAADASAHMRSKGKHLYAEVYNPYFTHHDSKKNHKGKYSNVVIHRNPNDYISQNLNASSGSVIINHEKTITNQGVEPQQPSPPPAIDTKPQPSPPPTSGNQAPSQNTNPPTSTPAPAKTKPPSKPNPNLTKKGGLSMAGGANANQGKQYEGYGVYGAQAKHDHTTFQQFLKDEKKKDPWVYWGIIIPATIIAGISTGGDAAAVEGGADTAAADAGTAADSGAAADTGAEPPDSAYHDASSDTPIDNEPKPDDPEAGDFHDAVQPMTDDEAWQTFNSLNADITRAEDEAGLGEYDIETTPKEWLQKVLPEMARTYANSIASRISILGAEYETAIMRACLQGGVPPNFAESIVRGCSTGIWMYAAFQIAQMTYKDIHDLLARADKIYQTITHMPDAHSLQQFSGH